MQRFFLSLMCILVLSSCLTPNTSFRLTNNSTTAVEISVARPDGSLKALGTLDPGASKSIGQARTLQVKNDNTHAFQLPTHILKWRPKRVEDRRIRYDLSYRIGDQIAWSDLPPRLEAIDSPQIVEVAGERIALPTASLGFPLLPLDDSQSTASADNEFQEAERRDIFKIGKSIEEELKDDERLKGVLAPIDWDLLQRVFGR